MKKLIFGLFTIVLFAGATSAQKVYTPAKGSAERTAIFNVLRVPVEKKLKQKIQFTVQTFNVQGSWAFVYGTLQNPSGGAPNFKVTEYQEAINEGMFDNNYEALLKKSGGKWRVVTYLIGCTDVCWEPWAEDYRAPKAIFKLAE